MNAPHHIYQGVTTATAVTVQEEGKTCSRESRPIIEATLPIIAERINDITPDFHRRMFAARPDLMDGMFSPLLSARRTQPKALAPSLCSLPISSRTPDSYPTGPLPRSTQARIPGLKEEEYPPSTSISSRAIVANLGDLATPEIVEAWTEVYWLMGNALIKLEKGLYASQANDVMFAPLQAR